MAASFTAVTSASITRVAGQNAGISANSTTAKVALPHNVTAGDTVIVETTAYQGSGSITVSMKAGTAKIGTPVKDKEYTNGAFTLAIWRVPVTGSGSLTMGATRRNDWYTFISLSEYKGMAANPVAAVDQNTATSTTEMTHAMANSAPGVVVMLSTENSTNNFVYAQSDNNIYNYSNGANGFTAQSQDKINAAAGSFTFSAGTGNNWTWYSVAVAYKAA